LYFTNPLDLPILMIVIATWQPRRQGIKLVARNHRQRHEMQNGMHIQTAIQHQCGSFES